MYPESHIVFILTYLNTPQKPCLVVKGPLCRLRRLRRLRWLRRATGRRRRDDAVVESLVFGFRVSVKGLGVMVQGLRFRVCGLGFNTRGL